MKQNLFSLLSSVAVAMHMNPFPESTGQGNAPAPLPSGCMAPRGIDPSRTHCLQVPYALRVGQKSRRHP